MVALRNLAYWLTIPISLALVASILLVPHIGGVLGLRTLGAVFIGAPLLAVALGATSVLAILQRGPRSAGYLTMPQGFVLLVLWLSVAGVWMFLVDVDLYTGRVGSAFTAITGSGGALSQRLFEASVWLSALSYALLLVLLLNGLEHRRVRLRRAAAHAGAAPVSRVTR